MSIRLDELSVYHNHKWYTLFKSDSNDWFLIPVDKFLNGTILYWDSDEQIMEHFESGQTGWIRVES